MAASRDGHTEKDKDAASKGEPTTSEPPAGKGGATSDGTVAGEEKPLPRYEKVALDPNAAAKAGPRAFIDVHKYAKKKNAERRRVRVRDFRKLEPWKRYLTIKWAIVFTVVGVAFMALACMSMHMSAENSRAHYFDPDSASTQSEISAANDLAASGNATHVLTGTYLENVSTIDLKNSEFTTTFLVWFKWNGSPDLDMVHHFNIFKGTIDSIDVLSEEVNGDETYQLARVKVVITKNFDTARFPLSSQQCNIYLESEYKAQDVILDPDLEDSAVNSSISVSGFTVRDVSWAQNAHVYNSTQGDPAVTEAPVTSEFVTSFMVTRDGYGLYFKCFLAMYGTSAWVLIMIYICGNHRVDAVGMIPGALFGTVSNIMVGAALVPDALSLGLLEYVNVWGIMTIIAAALAIIQIENIRSEHGRKDEPFARFFGRVMFVVVMVLAILGNIVLPLGAVFA